MSLLSCFSELIIVRAFFVKSRVPEAVFKAFPAASRLYKMLGRKYIANATNGTIITEICLLPKANSCCCKLSKFMEDEFCAGHIEYKP